MPTSPLGPLTTTFTPAADCDRFTVEYQIYGAGSSSTATYLEKYYPYFPSASRCFPPSFPTTGEPASAYYSPGLCPSAWTAFRDVLDVGTVTNALCCPPGFTVRSNYLACESTLSATKFGTVAVLTISDPQNNVQSLGTSTYYPVFPGSVRVIGVQVKWQSGDFANQPSAVSVTLTTAIPSTTSSLDPQSLSSTAATRSSTSSTPLTTGSEAQAPLANDAHSGLSNGAKIGLGVGVPLGVIALAILTFFLIKRWRRSRRIKPSPSMLSNSMSEHGAELPAPVHENSTHQHVKRSELAGHPPEPIHELGNQKPANLPTASELSGIPPNDNAYANHANVYELGDTAAAHKQNTTF